MSESAAEHSPRLREIHSLAEIEARVDELVERLYRDYSGTPATFVVIAEGGRRFAERLLKGLKSRKVTPEVVGVRARRTRGTTLGEVQVESIDPSAFEDRDVLIVDDIVDEGRTLEAVRALVEEGEPRSLQMAVLVSKRAQEMSRLPLRYVGFEVERGWVVGFGMDLEGRFRDLDALAVVEEQ